MHEKTMVIPLDLWILIAYQLQIQRNRESLLSLCMTSRAMNVSVTPFLYGKVELPTDPSVQSFCRTIQDSGTRLGPFVRSLSIGSYSSYRCWNRLELDTSLARSLGSALASLPCLRELTVALDPAGFSACFDPILTTDSPFSLHKLVIPLMGTSTFVGLLRSQSSIEELHVVSENNQFELSLALTLALDPEFLPNLTSITGPMVVLRAGVPRRPISEIMIVAELLDGADPSRSAMVIPSSNWEPVLSGSRVPITSIGFYQSPHSLDHWDLLLPALKQFGVDKSLERIRIVETLEPPITERSKQETLLHRVNQMKTLHGFDRLESIECAEMHSNLPATDVLRWLGSMKSVGAWKKCVPSLKQVRMYGVDLPWLKA
ncbi:hypothetical protein RSOL_018930 [Rhizoctonia solani AG-3 Rhs1AP]|uniref:F-box-like domain protein n=2 Tax=Rhizoctonia solani AG-3 TaxID=1086053 RepID=A0A074RYB2_9AGAM|nr:hypothetical protein RSOL_018930 [Rhizoctonia solani AG-3 Rhs1AP]KEP50260.1 hypothetical protein V565_083430 [Rhizoctonia solani 123E]